MSTRERYYDHYQECQHCYETFYSARYDAKFCSNKCRTAYHRIAAKRDAIAAKLLSVWIDFCDYRHDNQIDTLSREELSTVQMMATQIQSMLAVHRSTLPEPKRNHRGETQLSLKSAINNNAPPMVSGEPE